MDIHQGWNEDGKKAILCRPAEKEFYSWCTWDLSRANPATQLDAEHAFGAMLTSARRVVHGFKNGTPLIDDLELAPIRNLYAWHSSCKLFVQSKRVVLRTARSKIPSPADYQGTQTTSFCEQAVSAVDQLISQLWHFVESPNQSPEEQVQAASTRGDKLTLKPIHADDLLTLVSSELALLQWTAKRWTMKTLAERIGMSDDTLSRYITGDKAKGKRSQLTDEIVIQACQRVIAESPTESHRQGAESLLSELKR